MRFYMHYTLKMKSYFNRLSVMEVHHLVNVLRSLAVILFSAF